MLSHQLSLIYKFLCKTLTLMFGLLFELTFEYEQALVFSKIIFVKQNRNFRKSNESVTPDMFLLNLLNYFYFVFPDFFLEQVYCYCVLKVQTTTHN